jgi:hypothetical protein
MSVEIITKEDLQTFRVELLNDIKNLLESSGKLESKKWLRSPEVRKLLGISPGTLQNLRINGSIPYSKIGSLIYYPYDDVVKVLEKYKNMPLR